MEIPFSNLFLVDDVTKHFIPKKPLHFGGVLWPSGVLIPFDLMVGDRSIQSCMECTVVLGIAEDGLTSIEGMHCPESPEDGHGDSPEP